MEMQQALADPMANYEDAIDYLDDNFAYFVTNVLNIGRPIWDGRIPTACVALPDGKAVEKFIFMFNPQFASQLTVEQMGFVLAHETFHIILYHLTLGEKFSNKEVFNIAADCYDDQTEVLTDNGWKLFRDVDVAVDKAATRAADGTLEYQTPDKYIENDYDGELVTYSGRRLNFAVTPGHDMLVRPHHQSTRHKTMTMKAEDVEAGHRYLVPKTANATDNPDGTFDLSTVIPAVEKIKGQSHATPVVDRAKFARFLGMWLADGKKHSGPGGKNGFTTKITQTKPDGVTYIDKIMGELGWDFNRSEQKNGEAVWSITSDKLTHYLQELQEGDEIRLPSDVLTWSHDEQQALLEGYLVGDGTFSSQANRYTCMTSTSTKLLGDFQTLLINMGMCGNVSPEFEGGERTIKGQTVLCKPTWKLHIDLRPDAVLESDRMERVDYKGKVYCLSVPNKTLMVRRQGKMMWCRNCVINDYLEMAGLDLIDGICRGEDVVGFDCANTAVTDVYNLILGDEEMMKQLNGGCENPKDDGQACGECDTCKENAKKAQGQGQPGMGQPGQSGFVEIDNHDWMHDDDAAEKFADALQDAGFSPDDLPDDLEEVLNEAHNTFAKTKMAGKGQAQRDQYMKEQKITMKWLELLERVNPDMFHQPGAGPKPVTTFRTPRRKLISMYPKILVPNLVTPDKGDLSRKSDRKPVIVLALDTSGSIGDETANKFVNLARSIPQDKMIVKACTFTTVAMPLDLDNPTWRGGGTEFSCIEKFIRREVMPDLGGKYPKAVVVVTDGYASFYGANVPSKENAKSWSWLLLDEGQRMSAQNSLASHFGFVDENFELLDGYIDETIDWYAHGR